MANSEILVFAGDGAALVQSQAVYTADAQRLIGNQPGIAKAEMVNKAFRQSTLIAAAVAQFIAARQGTNVVDTLTPAQLDLIISNAFNNNDLAVLNVAGTADALVANFTPAATTRQAGLMIAKALATNATTTPTLARDGQAALTIVKGYNLPLVAGDIVAGMPMLFSIDTTLNKEVLLNPATGVSGQAVASTAEAQAQTDNTKIITPLRLSQALQGANQSLAANGWQRLPGGLILQWGTTASVGAGNNVVTTFPIAFPTACRSVVIGRSVASVSAQRADLISAVGITTFTANNGSPDAGAQFLWQAIGH